MYCKSVLKYVCVYVLQERGRWLSNNLQGGAAHVQANPTYSHNSQCADHKYTMLHTVCVRVHQKHLAAVDSLPAEQTDWNHAKVSNASKIL